MEYIQFGQTALRVSKISYGTWQFGGDWGRVERAQWEAGKVSVQKALELGINFFDTAQAYGFGLAERMLGEALQPYLRKGLREDLVLATKGGLRLEGDRLLRDASPRWLRQGVEQSLGNLGVDYIDLYQVHWPDPNTPIEETASALDQLVAGPARYRCGHCRCTHPFPARTNRPGRRDSPRASHAAGDRAYHERGGSHRRTCS